MLKEGMTIREATIEWVKEFNAFPQDMIKKLMQVDELSWNEVTEPSKGDRVYVYGFPNTDINGNEITNSSNMGEITAYNEDEEQFIIELDTGEKIVCYKDEFEVMYDSILPMWGYLWQFGDSCDDWWLENKDGIKIMSECGFRIYEHEEWGYFFGIDGAGYDFYGAHWIPLYKARGMQWHDPETEKED